MKKMIVFLLAFTFALIVTGGEPKYIFLFIGDGMATPQRMIAEEFSVKSGYGKLAINHLPFHATTRTGSANALITDSAAAATAIACGEKTANSRIGISADGKRKLESVAKVAKSKGKKVGIITSVTLNHATPAGFYANRLSRGEYYAIGLDLIASEFDYFSGGGVAKADDRKSPHYRGNIYQLAKKAGYTVVDNRTDLLKLDRKSGKVFARGAEGALPYSIDRIFNPDVPTLAEFTAKGIELLDNPRGFFMMVEGGAIDWAGHANEAATNLREVLAFDEAVKVALKFAKKHPDETLIVVTGDHETGGMTMGFAGVGKNIKLELLALQKCSMWQLQKMLAESGKDFQAAKKLLTEYFGLQFTGEGPMLVNKKELAMLEKEFKRGKLANAARLLVSKKAGIGWSSGSHTALPVLTTSTGVKAEMFTGFFENTAISQKLKSLL